MIAVNTTMICSSVITVPTTQRWVPSNTHETQFFNVVHVFALHEAFQHITTHSRQIRFYRKTRVSLRTANAERVDVPAVGGDEGLHEKLHRFWQDREI